MAEEFQEFEVIFSDRDHCRHLRRDDGVCGGREDDDFNFNCRGGIGEAHRSYKYHQRRTARDGGRRRSEMSSSSLPVEVPGRRTAEDDDEMVGDEMIPPHEVVERRVAGKMAFSVCTGNGRTLKGRDLSRVRNSILRLTGFLET